MFDTIYLSAPFVLTNHEDDLILYEDGFYIKYIHKYGNLIVQASMPVILYDNNLAEVTEMDVDRFFDILHTKIKKLFNKEVDRQDWQAYRIDYCKNFKLENQQQVTAYIHNLSKITLAYKKPVTYGQETVSFQNKSCWINFYDKHAEVKQHKKYKKDSGLVEQSKNILRYEIQMKKDALKLINPKRPAVEMLTKEVYNEVMGDQLDIINAKLSRVVSENELDPSLFDMFSYSKLEKIYAFSNFLDMFGEEFIKLQYDSSFYNRKKLLNKFQAATNLTHKQDLTL